MAVQVNLEGVDLLAWHATRPALGPLSPNKTKHPQFAAVFSHIGIRLRLLKIEEE